MNKNPPDRFFLKFDRGTRYYNGDIEMDAFIRTSNQTPTVIITLSDDTSAPSSQVDVTSATELEKIGNWFIEAAAWMRQTR